MKRNAILVAVILFVAGSARSYAQSDAGSRTGQDTTYHSGASISSDSEVRGGELFDRDPLGRIESPTPLDPPTDPESDPGFVEDDDAGLDAEGELIVNDEEKEVALEDDDDVEAHEYDLEEHAVGGPGGTQTGKGADSSIRGGSDRARGYDRSGNEHELSTEKMDTHVQAESSLRGGSNEARKHGYRHHEQEPGDGKIERRFKADSSIRGGSDRARGWDLKHPLKADQHLELESSGAPASSESGVVKEEHCPDAQDPDISGTYDLEAESEIYSSDLEMDTAESAAGAPAGSETGDYNADDSELNDDSSDLDQYSGEGKLDDADPDSSGSSATLQSDSEESSSEDEMPNDSESSFEQQIEGELDDADPDTGASELGRYSIEEHSDTRTDSQYDTEAHAEIATPLDEETASGRESYDRSEDDLSVTIDNDASVTRDAIGSPGSSQSESASSDNSSDSDVSAEVQAESDVEIEAEDPYHPSTRNEFEATGGLEGIESGTSESGEDSSKSYQPDFEADASIRTDSDNDNLDGPLYKSELGLTPNEPNWRFRSNPAHGVGGPAPFQTENAASTESDLAAKVKAQLSRESTGTFGTTRDDMRNIQVTSDSDGKITLRGSVASEQQKRSVELRAKEVAGVNSVDNQLSVSADALPQNREDNVGQSSNLDERRDELQEFKD